MVDRRGRLVGYDNDRRTRLRAHVGHDKVRLVCDKPLGGAEIAGPRTVIVLKQNDDGSVSLKGRAAVLGLSYQHTRAILRRAEAAV